MARFLRNVKERFKNWSFGIKQIIITINKYREGTHLAAKLTHPTSYLVLLVEIDSKISRRILQITGWKTFSRRYLTVLELDYIGAIFLQFCHFQKHRLS